MPDELGTEHRTRCDIGSGQPVTTSVIVSVAAVAGAEPTALPPLQRALDTDALEAVVRSAHEADTELTVSFEYAGYHVSIATDGSIRISETAGGS